MRTSSSSSAARARACLFDRRSWVVKMSTIWSPTVMTGLREFIADWKTIATSRHRSARSSSASRARMSRPRNRMDPPVITAGGRSSRMIALATVLLPQPDSPASPKISPRPIWKLTRSTARTVRYSPWYSTDRSETSRTGASSRDDGGVLIGSPPVGCRAERRTAAGPAPAGGPQPRVGDLVDAVVDERQGEGDEGDAQHPRARRPTTCRTSGLRRCWPSTGWCPS